MIFSNNSIPKLIIMDWYHMCKNTFDHIETNLIVIKYYIVEWFCPKNLRKEISLYRTTLFGVKLESKQKERRKAHDFLYLLYAYLGPRNSSRTPRNRFWLPRSSKNVKLPFLDSSIPRGVKFSEELPYYQCM